MNHTITITDTGGFKFIHADALRPLMDLGTTTTRRASHVEPAPNGTDWMADLSPVDGPVLGPFTTRAAALAAERRWIESYVL